MDALVIGCGVIGLTTAIRLAETGRQVTIWTAAMPAQTTSNVAAAVWYPYRAYPADRVLAWGSEAFNVFIELADDPRSGVTLCEGVELWRFPVPDPWWAESVLAVRRLPMDALPPTYHDSYLFTVPVIKMPVYLSYLLERFQALGGRVEQRVVRSLQVALAVCPVVVNCTGLGAREIVGDDTVQPIRGQVVRVENPGLDRFTLDEEHPDGVTYIVPRGDDCILGGTAEDGSWDLTPDPATADAIVRRCIELEPRLADAAILEHKVGLRPGRPAIRLERDYTVSGVCCVHNYGHGGAGVTLSWGCANEALRLMDGG